jgi:hypothetical protein
MPTNKEVLAQIKNAPAQIKRAAQVATLLGLLLAARAIILALSDGRLSVKSIVYCLIFVGFFATNGISLFRKSRTGFVLLLIFGGFPILGSFAGALHLLVLVLTGAFVSRVSETLASVICVLQLLAIVSLFVSMLSSTSRSYIWDSPAQAQ